MRVNPKIYNIVTTEPVDVQQLDGHNIEIYCLNDYPGILEEFTKKGRFAVWSSIDGTNYRLFIEQGYHKTLRELYGKRINTIWLDFWSDCENISNKFTKRIILPFTAISMLGLFLLMNFFPEQIYYSVILLGLFFVTTMVLRKTTNSKINMKNAEAVDKIKNVLGAKKFEQLLEEQRNYIDEYFGYNNEESEEEEKDPEPTLDSNDKE